MPQVTRLFAVVVIASGVVAFFGSSRSLADDMPVSMPPEAVGFNGTLIGEVVAPVGNGWFKIRVVQVVSYSPGNQTKLTPAALTAAWKDKYVAVRGIPDMPTIAVGDTVTITAAQFEMHIRSTKVAKQALQGATQPAANPSGDATARTPVVQVTPPQPHPATPATSQPATSPAAESLEELAQDRLKVAQVYMDNGLEPRAKEVLEEIVKLYPNTGAAKQARSTLVQRPEELAQARLKLAQVYLDSGMQPRAREILREIINLYPGTDAAKKAQSKLAELGG